jgi:hypothetical protein
VCVFRIGTDTSTGQNVGLLTRVDPVEDLRRFAPGTRLFPCVPPAVLPFSRFAFSVSSGLWSLSLSLLSGLLAS